jgi:alkylation response protein AidB-like acyl-CoA dehydrogenase
MKISLDKSTLAWQEKCRRFVDEELIPSEIETTAARALQILGGRGYMRENCAERFMRELRVDRIWEGAGEVQRLVIANALKKRGLDGM